MLVGYARVSTREQKLDRQIDVLVKAGVDRRNIYQEKVTGTKLDREMLNKMIEELQPNDTVIISDLTRLGRKTRDLYKIIDEIHSKGANIKSIKEAWLDTSTPQGELMFTIFAALAEFERDLLSERTKEGLRAAKARGRNGGRPKKRTEKSLSVITLYEAGIKQAEIVRQTGLSRSTVYRVLKDHYKDKKRK